MQQLSVLLKTMLPTIQNWKGKNLMNEEKVQTNECQIWHSLPKTKHHLLVATEYGEFFYFPGAPADDEAEHTGEEDALDLASEDYENN
ncbi:hypothetical protein IV203_015279 [Nitzschia inconspicua]|uniref:Uncharacterized protein n=1 Tax=Nitzschia inconspicua TaxID=303405 RepID=A0A9K3P8N8_9STRA|nr:hypothetical protein IV203_020234 [Nitzschia inconspicua]KAG7358690.1 hypothetical protein IV203_015279 [Nitzschia inconspicua]